MLVVELPLVLHANAFARVKAVAGLNDVGYALQAEYPLGVEL